MVSTSLDGFIEKRLGRLMEDESITSYWVIMSVVQERAYSQYTSENHMQERNGERGVCLQPLLLGCSEAAIGQDAENRVLT